MKKNGFTLAETTVTITIFVIMTVLVVSFYISGLRIYREKTAERDLIFGAQTTLTDIKDNVQKTINFVEDIIINSTNYVADSSTLILEIPAIDETGETIYQGSDVTVFDYIIYEYNSGSEEIVKHLYPDATSSRTEQEDRVLMSQVSSFSFGYSPDDPPTDWNDIENMTANITAYKIVSKDTKEITLSNTIKPRNN